MREWEKRVENTARQIEAYLESHPQAADTAEGIATWWISNQRIQYELGVVLAALKQLTQAGIVSVEKTTTGRNDPLYQLNKRQ